MSPKGEPQRLLAPLNQAENLPTIPASQQGRIQRDFKAYQLVVASIPAPRSLSLLAIAEVDYVRCSAA